MPSDLIHAALPPARLADDLLYGVAAIAAYIGTNHKTTYELIARGSLPVFRLPGCGKRGKIHARKSQLDAHLRAPDLPAPAPRPAAAPEPPPQAPDLPLPRVSARTGKPIRRRRYLTAEQRTEVLASDATDAELAARFGVTRQAINKLRKAAARVAP